MMQQAPKEHYDYPDSLYDVHYGSIYGLEDEENVNGSWELKGSRMSFFI